MNNETNTVPVATVTPEATTTVKPTRKSKKGKWGKVGAPPKDIKLPRGAYTIQELVAFQGKDAKGNPTICELTLRNYVTDHVRGYKIVKKVVDGKKVVTQVSVPVTIVKLSKNAEKDTVGRPNYRYMSKAAFEANQKNLKKVKISKTESTPSETVAA